MIWPAEINEISTEQRSTLLRTLAASIQTDGAVAQQFRADELRGPAERILVLGTDS